MTLTFETRKSYSLDEFFTWVRLHGDPDADYELINGEIVEKDEGGRGGPSGRHALILSRLVTTLSNYVHSQNNVGQIFTNGPFLLPKDETDILEPANGSTKPKSKGKRQGNYLKPDVAFVKAGRVPDRFDGAIPAVPDLVVEINSPSDDGEHIEEKIQTYKKAGVALIWSIYMMEEFVVIYRLGEGDKELLNLRGELDGGDVLPGFRYKVNELLK